MRVLLTSTSYPRAAADWRGRFIADMVSALAARKDLHLSCWMPPGEPVSGVADAASPSDRRWLDKLASQGGIAHALRTRPLGGLLKAAGLLRRLRSVYRREDWDVAHVNWLQNALPLPKGKPAVITVLGTDFGLLRLPAMAALLRAALRNRPALLAPNADWMVPELRRLFGDLALVKAIPFGVHQRWFAVEPMPSTEPVPWLVVSRVTQAKLGHLLTWGEGRFGPERPLILFGPMQEQVALPAWVDYRGATHPEALAKDWFPRAAGLISLSTHDEGRPQIMLDAMAAALPIIASDIPAHRDLLRHRKTGWLTDSPATLDEGLRFFDKVSQRRHLGQAARAWVKTEIGDWSDCAARYVAAYREVLGGSRP
ncbi:MAG: glycosyltransferase [Rhodocyclaceae bacterium]|nr:glycosyltransferase [Rhodocyclaceae bacterium]